VTDLGRALRAAGLVPRALAAWAGTDRIAVLRTRVADPHLASDDPVPAAAALALFVAGAAVALDRVRGLPLDELIAASLVQRDGDRVRASVAIVPLGASLLVCDRLDAPDDEHLVCWPDDSSHHLAAALPADRRATWIDLGCGSAFAPLARPELAKAITGIDINPRAVAHARMGAALSGIAHLAIEEADVGGVRGTAELVTCNAPIPGEWDEAVWRRADETLFARLWPAVRASLAEGGEAIVHALLAAIPDDLPGESVTGVYTPPGTRAFAVVWWRPDAPLRRVRVRRELTADRPHVEARDRDAALAGTMTPLDT
jgi:SAM-dependent methyltransferase